MSEISITYDLLFDVLRMEKSRDDLQKLDDQFYTNVVDYLISKESIISNPNTPPGERELTRIQLGNVKRLLVELYDRREKKIINLAIYKIKTSSGLISTETLLSEEKALFEKIHVELYRHRLSVLNNVLEGKIPLIVQTQNVPVGQATNKDADSDTLDDFNDGTIKSVRFIKPVPRFLGTELETYGPYEENDIASLPSKIANILIKKSRAEEMNVN